MRSLLPLLGAVCLGVLPGCGALSAGDAGTPWPDAGPCAPGTPCGPPLDGGSFPPLAATVQSTQFVVRDHMIAAFEMQLSGEPLAQAMGRQLTGYSRDHVPPNLYFDPAGDSTGPWTDLAGFATAVESYEYSKQPMNNLNLESGAGVSLLAGPVINPSSAIGTTALSLMQDRVQHFAGESNVVTLVSWCPADQTPCTSDLGPGMSPPDGGMLHGVPLPGEPPTTLGWPGLWPTMHPYDSFDPSINASNQTDWLCSIASDDDPGDMNLVLNEDYECDYTSLHLPDRASQVSFVITPGSSGWAGWKSALWTVNYLQIMHDSAGNAVATVAPSELSEVGRPGNMIVGQPSTPCPPVYAADGGIVDAGCILPGTYLGSSNIEGFQAAMMIEEIDNAAEHWLQSLTTTDGVTLSGFPGTGVACPASNTTGCDPTVMAALSYDYTSPLRWIPEEIAVTEAPVDSSGFPLPASYSIQSSGSSLIDLLGLLGAYSEFYTLTDLTNSNVGGTQTAEVYFDGDPFPRDDQLPDGEATLHDRAAAMMRFLVVDLDRIHGDPTTGILADDVQMTGGVPVRGSTIATDSAAYALVALRNVRRALGSALSLYSNTTPDEAFEELPLDMVVLNGAPGGATFTQRLNALIQTHVDLLYGDLTTSDGHVYAGWDFSAGAPTSTADTLDSYTAAIRGLLQAYLCTGNTIYRTRALAVFNRMDSVFWDPIARVYNTSPGSVSQVTYTPRRFSLLEGALRDLYELWGAQPGHEAFGQHLENLVARNIKLILNGWDDSNGDGVVEYPTECVHTLPCSDSAYFPCSSDGDVVGAGGLQMAERALSGELGSVNDSLAAAGSRVITVDRESDCVPDIAAAGLPSALADQITFQYKLPNKAGSP